MDILRNKFFIIAVAAIAVGLMLWGLYYFAFVRSMGPRTPEEQPIPSTPIVAEQAKPGVTIEIKDPKTVLIRWEYLPDGTAYLNIFRRKNETDPWVLWKRVAVDPSNLIDGSIELLLAEGENPGDYTYYVEAVSGNSDVLWVSSSTQAIPPEVPGSEGQPPQGENPPPSQTPTSTDSSNNQGENPPPPSEENPPSGGESGGGTQSPDNTIYYYSPELILTASSTPQGDTFWVRHAGDSIEIGWQNISTSSTKAIVSRSKVAGSPWTELLTQENPVHSEPYVIRIVDNTLHEDYYYKMDLYVGSTLSTTYGPILLRGLP